MKKVLLMLFIAVLASGCSTMKSGTGANTLQLTGTIEKMGITTFQYGSHMLREQNKSYALKSSTVNLNDYMGKVVKVTGVKIDGYPVENGPDFIEVSRVESNQ